MKFMKKNIDDEAVQRSDEYQQSEGETAADGTGSRDAARLGSLMSDAGNDRTETDRNRPSIPMPGYETGTNGENSTHDPEVWNASGAMTLNDYQRLRAGYERGLSPEARERMGDPTGDSETGMAGAARASEERYDEETSSEPTRYDAGSQAWNDPEEYDEYDEAFDEDHGYDNGQEEEDLDTERYDGAVHGNQTRYQQIESNAQYADSRSNGAGRAYGSEESPYGEGASYGAATTVISRQGDSYEQHGSYESQPRRSRGIGPIAIAAILLFGVVGGLVLYAGGAEYISNFFSSQSEQSDEELTRVTERPGTERSEALTAGPTPGEMMEGDSESDLISAADLVREDSAAEAERVKEEMTPPDEAYLDREAEKKKAEAAKAAAAKAEAARLEKAKLEKAKLAAEAEQKRKEELRKQKEDAEVKAAIDRAKALDASTSAKSKQNSTDRGDGEKRVTAAASAPTSGSFAVQIRATPSKDEANRVAAGLRSRGGSNVQVVPVEKNGETIYRVRFGSFGSQDEARQKASSLGYDNVWVIKK